MKIKLVIVNHALSQSHRAELCRYFITEGHLDHWLYSTPKAKRIETDFSVMACNPA